MSVSRELSLGSSTPPDSNFMLIGLDRRKRDVQDILSSFEADVLPSELRPDIYHRITNEQSTRPSLERTIFGDLLATLFNWAVHDDHGWTFINKWLPASTRARFFIEKLQRRFRQELDTYDKLTHPQQHHPSAQSRAHVSSMVAQVAESINSLVDEAVRDLDYRSVGQKNTVTVLLEAFEAICARSEDISPAFAGGGPLTSRTEFGISLYNSVIRQPPTGTPTQILGALETVFRISPNMLSAMDIRHAHPKFQELCTQAEEAVMRHAGSARGKH